MNKLPLYGVIVLSLAVSCARMQRSKYQYFFRLVFCMKTLITLFTLILTFTSCGPLPEYQKESGTKENDNSLNQQIVCPEVYSPVCGSNGVTYSNSCHAQAAGIVNATQGQCESNDEQLSCPSVYEPVCGTNGQTYSSACHAGLAGATVDHQGACQTNNNCVCTMNYAPVCGSDGVTYSNSCMANCANVSIASTGACQ